ncbi:MAG TPA: hypothetical protein VLL08_09535 [Kineosporiaceae bacterium]|nr:hypothetical protein [Kineosporiaceae bacterium]
MLTWATCAVAIRLAAGRLRPGSAVDEICNCAVGCVPNRDSGWSAAELPHPLPSSAIVNAVQNSPTALP